MSDAPSGPVATTPTNAKKEDDAPAAPVAEGERPMIAVKIYSPFRIFYEGKGYSLTAANAVGPFDVLPHHHNFLCMLVPCDVIIETSYGKETVRISQGLMHVKAEKVTIFVDV
jgi:F0F1-type ATP synthase epsilon subunit